MHFPKVFISYAWDSDNFNALVRGLAERLRNNGVESIIDQWAVHPGDQLSLFMEQSIRESDFTLVICTPKYKSKSDSRIGGVGYEGDIITAEITTGIERRKFIPVLMSENWKCSAPSWLLGSSYIDLYSKDNFESNFAKLVATINGTLSVPPPISFGDSKSKSNDIPDPATALQLVLASLGSGKSLYPIAVDPKKVAHYGRNASSGGGFFYDDVLEYRVWGHPYAGAPGITNGDDYLCAFPTFEAAYEFSLEKGFEEPLVLVRQLEWINEPSPGKYVHMKTERITEWCVEWLKDHKRKPWSIPNFIKEKAGGSI